MVALDHARQVAHLPRRARILHQHTERVGGQRLPGVLDDDLDTQRFGPSLHHGDGLRETVGIDDEHVALALAGQQRHRFGGGRRLVEQRGVGELAACQVGDHRLEVQDRFEAALGDLRLVFG